MTAHEEAVREGVWVRYWVRDGRVIVLDAVPVTFRDAAPDPRDGSEG